MNEDSARSEALVELHPDRRSFRHLRRLLPVVCLLLASCASSQGPAGDPAFQAAEAAYMSQNYTPAVHSYTVFIDKKSSSPYKADAYYGRGMSYLALKDYPRAAADLQRAADEAGDRALRAHALYRLGQAAGLCGNFAKAEATYRRLLTTSQSTVGQDELNYLLGLACLRQGKWEEADDQFRTVARTYPSSSFRTLAEGKLANRDRFFTVQVGAYSTMSAAEARQRQLAAFGQQPFIRTVTRQGATYYCVRTGRFNSWNAARHYLNVLYSTGITDSMVVP